MPRIPIIMPQLGESIAEATIVRLPFDVGADVETDQ
jgi:pyruvate/2-oxoglutarate dehydrogenase complex dihydrolipoamide acyltransferase (E2) component